MPGMLIFRGDRLVIDLLRRQSFAKNAGLYSERVGALHVVPPNAETANRVKSQLSVLQRSEISNPPAHGARLVRGHPIFGWRFTEKRTRCR